MNSDPKKIKELNKTEKKAIILQALQKEGYNDSESSQLLDVSRARVAQINKKTRSGKLSPILDKSTIKKVKKNLAMLIDGQPVGAMDSIKGADVLGAIKIAADRIDPPVTKTENTNISARMDIRPEDRERFGRLLGLKVVDAEYELLPEPEQKQIESKEVTADEESNSKAD